MAARFLLVAACPDESCLISGDAGRISLTADQLRITNGSISSTTGGQGAAGVIDIDASELTMSGGEIATRALDGSSGISGQVSIAGDQRGAC
jgi:hypothetical protein